MYSSQAKERTEFIYTCLYTHTHTTEACRNAYAGTVRYRHTPQRHTGMHMDTHITEVFRNAHAKICVHPPLTHTYTTEVQE